MRFQDSVLSEKSEPLVPVSAIFHPMMLDSETKRIKQLADSAMKRSGCSYEVYIDQFSDSVNRVLEGEQDQARKGTILYVAQAHDYHSPDDVSEMKESCLEEGLCIHGIDPDCCPVGCGEVVEIDEIDESQQDWLDRLDGYEADLEKAVVSIMEATGADGFARVYGKESNIFVDVTTPGLFEERSVDTSKPEGLRGFFKKLFRRAEK